jgi:hypothetical protein
VGLEQAFKYTAQSPKEERKFLPSPRLEPRTFKNTTKCASNSAMSFLKKNCLSWKIDQISALITNWLQHCLPCSLQSWDGPVPEPWDDCEHRVEVVGLLTLPGDLDKLFDNPHPFSGIWLRDNLTYSPHHFAIYLKQNWDHWICHEMRNAFSRHSIIGNSCLVAIAARIAALQFYRLKSSPPQI